MGNCCASRERDDGLEPADKKATGLALTPRSECGDETTGLRSFCPQRVHLSVRNRYEFNDSDSIGCGQSGTVFVARDKRYNQRVVAIKKVWTKNSTQQLRDEFNRERSIMQELDHPNICKLLETYDEGRFMYFVMEYCAGKEVFVRISDSGAICETVSADIVKQVASALNHAHAKGIAHRDIKPENVVFVTDDEKCNDIKVIDWGIGFFFNQAKMHSAVGSQLYIAPEVLTARSAHEGYSCACDAFSLGVMTYVMLAGRVPFWGNVAQQLDAKQKGQYPMENKVWNGVSDAAQDFIRSLLKPNPEERLAMDAVMVHPWLEGGAQKTELVTRTQVLSNISRVCDTSRLMSIIMTSIARQMHHQSFKDVHQVFQEMDTNGDGVLDLNEMQAGFFKMNGNSGGPLADIPELFEKLDVDHSGTIDYTEFCMAGADLRSFMEEDVLWAAFKAFDVHDQNKLTKKEVVTVLKNGRFFDEVWDEKVCEKALSELDKDNDGDISFEEWLEFMRHTAQQCSNVEATVEKRVE